MTYRTVLRETYTVWISYIQLIVDEAGFLLIQSLCATEYVLQKIMNISRCTRLTARHSDSMKTKYREEFTVYQLWNRTASFKMPSVLKMGSTSSLYSDYSVFRLTFEISKPVSIIVLAKRLTDQPFSYPYKIMHISGISDMSVFFPKQIHLILAQVDIVLLFELNA